MPRYHQVKTMGFIHLVVGCSTSRRYMTMSLVGILVQSLTSSCL